jgi:hypothetical protein
VAPSATASSGCNSSSPSQSRITKPAAAAAEGGKEGGAEPAAAADAAADPSGDAAAETAADAAAEPAAAAAPVAAPEAVKKVVNLGKTGGVYVPPFKLARMMADVSDRVSPEYQRLTWEVSLRPLIMGQLYLRH